MKRLRQHRSDDYLPVAGVDQLEEKDALLVDRPSRRNTTSDCDLDDLPTTGPSILFPRPGVKKKISSIFPRLVLQDIKKPDNVTPAHEGTPLAGPNKETSVKTPAAGDIPGSFPDESIEGILDARFEVLMKSKPSNPSILSGSSRASGARHALLKPAVLADQPVDTGLPLPPVLTPPPDVSQVDSEARHGLDSIVQQHSNTTVTTKYPGGDVVKKITDVKYNAQPEQDRDPEASTSTEVKSHHFFHLHHGDRHLQDVKYDVNVDGFDADLVTQNNPLTEPEEEQPGLVPRAQAVPDKTPADIVNERHPEDSPIQAVPAPKSGTATPSNPFAAAYWRLIPAVRDAVQDAVLAAVRSAVHEVAALSGNKVDENEDVHRQLVADSLTQALKTEHETLATIPQNIVSDRRKPLSMDVNLLPLEDRNHAVSSPLSQIENEKQGNDGEFAPPHASGAPALLPIDEFTLNRRQQNTSVPPRSRGGPLIKPAAIPERRSSKRLSKLRKEVSRSSDRPTVNRKPKQRSMSDQAEPSIQQVPNVSSRRHEDAQRPVSPEAASHSNPSTWLRDFLHPRTEPYVSQLTEMPVRSRKASNIATAGETIPADSQSHLNNLSTEVEAGSLHSKPVRIRTNSGMASAERYKVQPEAFTKTINDLEGLLGEALNIAQQAAGKEHGHVRSRSEPGYPMDDHCSLDEAHESGRSHSGSSATQSGEDIEFSNYMALYPEPDGLSHKRLSVDTPRMHKGHPSGWPPTGRAMTPIPPRSQPGSLKSVPAAKRESLHEFELVELDNHQSHNKHASYPQTIANMGNVRRSSLHSLHSYRIEQHPSPHRSIVASFELAPVHSLDGSHPSEAVDFDHGNEYTQHQQSNGHREGQVLCDIHEPVELRDVPAPNLPIIIPNANRMKPNNQEDLSLSGKRHVSLKGQKAFSLARSHKRQPIARDWSPGRKRYSAAVSCISTALIGLLVGIYAGEVPAIQYYIVDFHHYTILGNVFFYVGLAIPTLVFWPLPLLHGRKPYVLGAMTLAMPLLFPQAVSVSQFRSPYVRYWRIALLLPRGVMGLTLGFANMNFKNTLLDLFGASLQSANPHQEVVDDFDVRRHGGGMGAWLGLWTWCSIGTIGLGFLVGASVIWHLEPALGFYISIAIIAFVLFLNVVAPEVRRSSFRRSVAEVRKEGEVSRRLARGEVCLHMIQTGPKWWGEEFHQGVMLSLRMLRQPGFLVLALYVAWIYGQIVLVIVLLGSLTSRDYKFLPPYVGLSTSALPIGALLSIPFQKAGLFSREREQAVEADSATFLAQVTWTSHLVRRTVFVIVLPFAGLGYTLSSQGPPTPFIIPILFAGLIGFLSNLAIAECNGIIMETFDTSDLQPGMTGRPRGKSGERTAWKRTNYSSFPRVASAFALCQGFGFLFGALATGVGGVIQRKLGQQAATGVMAGILLILSILLLAVLVRFKEVQIIPDSKKEHMERWTIARRASSMRPDSQPGDDEPWRPVIIGNPTGTTRRMNILELGGMSRFSEIRKKNRLVDEMSLEAKHPNLAALESVEHKLSQTRHEISLQLRRGLSREGSRRSRKTQKSSPEEDKGPSDLGGLREMSQGSRRRKGKEPAQD